MSCIGAKIVAEEIHKNPKCILGLATGSTPVGMYNELSRMYKEGQIDFSQVTTFNLDEYYPMHHSDPNSYHYFMEENLFKHINVKSENIHLLSGETDNPEKECEEYEKLINAAGGIDLQVLGVGPNGHIGFNEPCKELTAQTHLTSLTESTIEANSRFFDDVSMVPKQALTMGMATILKSKKIILLISGDKKAHLIKNFFSGKITTDLPVSFLQLHPDVTVITDIQA
jgi:glucosamine-6-phosphate deaminase